MAKPSDHHRGLMRGRFTLVFSRQGPCLGGGIGEEERPDTAAQNAPTSLIPSASSTVPVVRLYSRPDVASSFMLELYQCWSGGQPRGGRRAALERHGWRRGRGTLGALSQREKSPLQPRLAAVASSERRLLRRPPRKRAGLLFLELRRANPPFCARDAILFFNAPFNHRAHYSSSA